MEQLYSEARLRIDNLTSAVSTLKIKYATLDEIRYYHQAIKCMIISWASVTETAVEAYIDKEDDEDKSEEVNDLMFNAFQEAVNWFEDLEQAWSTIRSREILVLEEIRKNVDPFQERDNRCVYEFLQQIAPLAGLPQKRAVEVLVEELLAPKL